jgi:hypothetical protein
MSVLIDCPFCGGKGGTHDPWGEWDDCPCCHGKQEVTHTEMKKYHAWVAQMDAEYERLVNAAGA